MPEFRDEIDRYVARHGRPEKVELLLPDMHGVFRGKILAGDDLDKIASGGARFPVSTQGMDVFGCDVDGTGLALHGDPDGVVLPVPGTLAPVPWLKRPTAQVLLRVLGDDGAPSLYDPRTRLEAQLARAAALRLSPVAACELEFFFVKRRARRDEAPSPPDGGLEGNQVYDYEAIERRRDVLEAIEEAALAQDIPVAGFTAEYEPGQFEINFAHRADLARAADDALLFRRVVKSVARAHGLDATFMACPYVGRNASGLHVHMSMLDDDGRNIFDAEPAAYGVSAPLGGAITAMLDAMKGTQAIYAPHRNSFRRLAPLMSAPQEASWGLDHRAASIRVPATRGKAARFEHRLAGSDANPTLVLTAILAACLDGIENPEAPPPPLGSDGAAPPPLPTVWETAIANFERSPHAERALGEEYRRVFAEVRKREIARMNETIPPAEYEAYLHRF